MTQRTWFDRGDLIQDLRDRIAPERPTAGQELIEDYSQAEDIGAAVNPMPLAAGLFGARVSGSAGETCLPAEVFVAKRQSEIGQERLAGGVDQDVGRLDVAMDQAARIGVVERKCD